MHELTINLKDSYKIIIGENINVESYIKEIYSNKKIYLILDKKVYKLYTDKIDSEFKNFDVSMILIEASEQNKSLETYHHIIDNLLKQNITRDSLLISIGGGVIGDIASFVASTILRGIKYMSIPTTLLSQVDSSIGGKTGLNHNNIKNVIGTFYQPSLVLIDTKYLATLSKDEFDNGLCEVIKCGMIYDKEIIALLKDNYKLEDVILKSLLTKKYYVEKDEFDTGDRMILNFGHTFGHVIELEENIKHGLAVASGMLMMINYGIDNDITNKSNLEVLIDILNSLNIKVKDYDYKEYINKLNHDKKNSQEFNKFILLKDINEPIIKKIKRG